MYFHIIMQGEKQNSTRVGKKRFIVIPKRKSIQSLVANLMLLIPDSQSNISSHAFSSVKDRPLYLNFSIPPCEKSSFSLGLIGPMRIKLMWTCT